MISFVTKKQKMILKMIIEFVHFFPMISSVRSFFLSFSKMTVSLLSLFVVFSCFTFTFGSYLSNSSVWLSGQFTTPSATLNNFVRNFDPANRFNMTPWWNPAGLNGFSLTAQLTGGAAALGCAANGVLKLSEAFLVDIDPDQQFVSELFSASVWTLYDSLGQHALLNATLGATFGLQRQWSQAAQPRPHPQPIGLATTQRAAVLVLTLDNVKVSAAARQCSPALRTVRRSVALRLAMNNFDSDSSSPTFASGDLAVTLGPAPDVRWPDPTRLAGVAVAGAPHFGPGVPFAIVDGVLLVDLATAVPTAVPGGANLFAQLRLGVQRGAAVVWLANGLIASDVASLQQVGFVVPVPLTAAEQSLLASRPLVIADANGAPLVRERDDGVLLRVFPRVIRVRDHATPVPITVRSWRFGVPQSTTVAVHAVPSPMRARPDRVNNDPAGVVKLSVGARFATNGTGVASVSVVQGRSIAVGDLPAPRQPMRSQMYFLQLTDASSAPVANDTGGSDLLSVRVWATLPPTVSGNATLTWADVSFLFEPYSWLYPSMQSFADMSSAAGVAASRRMIAATMSAGFFDDSFMPVTRDLDISAQQRMIDYCLQMRK